MKTYRIRYVIVDGEHEYADEMTVSGNEMTAERAVRHIAEFWLPDSTPEYRQRFQQVLLREDFAFLPAGSRAIEDVVWEEVAPIIITISDGLIENIVNIPEGQSVEIRDWDAAELDASGECVPEITVWGRSGNDTP